MKQNLTGVITDKGDSLPWGNLINTKVDYNNLWYIDFSRHTNIYFSP